MSGMERVASEPVKAGKSRSFKMKMKHSTNTDVNKRESITLLRRSESPKKRKQLHSKLSEKSGGSSFDSYTSYSQSRNDEQTG